MVNNSKKNRHINLYETIRSACLFLMMIAIFISMPSAINAKIYKWVDEQGNIHYGAEKPEDAEAERLRIEQKPIFGGEDVAEEDKSKDKKGAKEEEKEKEKAEKKEERLEGDAIMPKKEKRRLCKQARDRVQNIKDSGRLRAYDEKGNSRILSDKERNKRLSSAQANVKEYCH